MPELGSLHRAIPTTVGSTKVEMTAASLAFLKSRGVGHNEFRITSATATIQVVNKRENDGDIVAMFLPKAWTPPTVDEIRLKAGFEKHVSAQPWTVQLSSAGEWTNLANVGAVLWLAGTGLEKETNVHVTVRGHVQYR